jgi:hypothetical protein
MPEEPVLPSPEPVEALPVTEPAEALPPGAHATAGDTADETDPGATAKEQRASREAWAEVGSALDELIQAIGNWAKSLKDDPDNKRHAGELKDRLEGLGEQIGGAFDSASQTEVGQKVSEAANRAGVAVTGAAKKVGTEVAPHIAIAFRSAAEGMHKAAEELDKRASQAVAEHPEAAEPEYAPRTHSEPHVPGDEHDAPPATSPNATPGEAAGAPVDATAPQSDFRPGIDEQS